MPLTIRVDVHHHFDQPAPDGDRLGEILNAVRQLTDRMDAMATELEELEAAVEENTTVDGSVIALVNQLAAQIAALGQNATDLATLKAALVTKAAQLRASNRAVADAVTANTPAAP